MFKNLFIALILLLTTASCNHSILGQRSFSTSQIAPSYLFVILSNYGLVQEAGDGSYQLILDHGDVEKVLAFTNSPYRLVQHITAQDLQSI